MAAKSIKLKEDLYYCGVYDEKLRIFDIVMMTPFGSTYNAYIVKGKKHTVLIETVKEKFYDEMVQRIEDAIGKDGKIDYIIHNHTEPDHTGSSHRLIMEKFPEAKVIGSQNAVAYLKDINKELSPKITYLVAGKDIQNLDIGGYTLQFTQAPFLHWPDSMFTYIPEMKAAFTCDFFGSHYCFPELLDSKIDKWGDFMEAYKYYYDAIFGPFPKYVLDGCKIIRKYQKTTGLEFIGNSHGPMLTDAKMEELVSLYEKWGEAGKLAPEKRWKDGVTIVYVSAYGYTEEIAKAMKEGIEAQGIPVKMFDAVYAKEEEIAPAMSTYRGLLFGSPTLINDALPQIWQAVNKLNPMINMGQMAGTFGSYGWSGEACQNLDQRLKQLKLKQPLDPFTVKFRPSKAELENAKVWAGKFARAVKGEKIMERKKELAKAEGKKTKEEAPKYPTDGKLRKWKCIVCGEIFQSVLPPNQCPACSAEGDIWVEVGVVEAFEGQEKPEPSFKGTVAVIGGCGAGFSAVKAIREKNAACKVLLFSDEGMPYYRPTVTKQFEYMTNEKWLEQNKVELIKEKVTAVNSSEKTLKVSSGKTYSFDRAILAVGSKPFSPFPKADNVFTVKTPEDMERIVKFSLGGKGYSNPVFIGGGLLGLEAAERMVQVNSKNIKKMTMIEVMNRILPRQLDQVGSEIYAKMLVNQGLELKIGTMIDTFALQEVVDPETNEKKTIAHKIKFKDGTELETDCIVVAIGVKPDLELAQQVGAKAGRAIQVDEEMKTSVSDIYAAGDCTEVNGMWIPNWPNAIAQGMVAGWSASGFIEDIKEAEAKKPFRFTRESSPYNLTSFGAKVFSLGEVNECTTFLTKRDGDDQYVKIAFDKEKKMCGALLIGKDILPTISTTALTRGVAQRISVLEAAKLLANA